jgi:hypothetical protein
MEIFGQPWVSVVAVNLALDAQFQTKPPKKNGAAYRTRTCDPRITNARVYLVS